MTFQTKLMSNFTASVGPVHMSTGTRFYLKTENSLLFTVLKTIISSALTVLESAFACLHVLYPSLSLNLPILYTD